MNVGVEVVVVVVDASKKMLVRGVVPTPATHDSHVSTIFYEENASFFNRKPSFECLEQCNEF